MRAVALGAGQPPAPSGRPAATAGGRPPPRAAGPPAPAADRGAPPGPPRGGQPSRRAGAARPADSCGAAARAWPTPTVARHPAGVDGCKPIAYEIAQQLAWQAPDAIILPVAYGDSIAGIHRGFEELLAAGLVSRLPRLVAAETYPSLTGALAQGAAGPIATGGAGSLPVSGAPPPRASPAPPAGRAAPGPPGRGGGGAKNGPPP